LVVIAVIGILMALLLPAVQAVREAARRTQCRNNLRQVALAAHLYHDTLETLPAGWIADPGRGSPGWGWASRLLPFMEQGNLDDLIDRNLAIDDPAHASVVNVAIPTYLCPSDPSLEVLDLVPTVDNGGLPPPAISAGSPLAAPATPHASFYAARGNYSGVFGTNEIEVEPDAGNGCFFRNSKLDFADVTDGLSNTLLIGERTSEFGGVTWLGAIASLDEPGCRIVGSADHAPNADGGHMDDFRSHHLLGVNFALADGSVRLINESVDLDAYRGAATRSGREIPGDF
jgi:hypothetical protein